MSPTDKQIMVWGILIPLVRLTVFLCDKLSQHGLDRKYRKERRRFETEVAAGRTPEWAPIHYTLGGGISVNPNDIIRSAKYKRDVERLDTFWANRPAN
jgi:hypothetical protein